MTKVCDCAEEGVKMSNLRETAKELSMLVWRGDTQLRAEGSMEEGEKG